FLSSRRRHTSLQGDWSSDVCSSDRRPNSSRRSPPWPRRWPRTNGKRSQMSSSSYSGPENDSNRGVTDGEDARQVRRGRAREGCRSEERRVGKGVGNRWSGRLDTNKE